MAWAEIVLGSAARAVTPVASWLWNVVIQRGKPLLSVSLEPFEDLDVLRAFSVQLVNASDEVLRLERIYIKRPEGSPIAYRWRVPLYFIDEGPRYEPWKIIQQHNFGVSLEPGEKQYFEIGLPEGFAISASRRIPVSIGIDMRTFGERERRVTQEIHRLVNF